MQNVSTPNDYAVTYVDAFDNTVTVMVCKYQEGPEWIVRRATEFGGPHNVMNDKLCGCSFTCFS